MRSWGSKFPPILLLLAVALLPGWCVGEELYGPEPLVQKVGQTGGPRIFFQEETFDWGSVLQGDDLEHTFVFTNKGTETLRILDVKPG